MKNFVPTLSTLLNKENLGLYQMMKYHFGIDNGVDSDSSHNFPLGTISELFCNHFSIDIKNSNLISSSLELLNASFEVHEDVRNGNTERFSKESLWWKYGPAQAINVGDGFQALSRSVILEISDNLDDYKELLKIISKFDTSIIKICESENFELDLQEKPVTTTEDYLSVAENKFGTLLGLAISIPLIISKSKSDNYNEIANYLMIYEKIRQDVDFLSDDSPNDSAKFGGILSKNKPLPVILIFEKGNATQKRKIGEIYLDRIIDPKKVPEIKDLCIELDTINDSIIMAEKYKEKTDLKLDELGFSDSSKNEIYENLSYL